MYKTTIYVFDTEYFSGEMADVLAEVADFWDDYCIVINFEVYEITEIPDEHVEHFDEFDQYTPADDYDYSQEIDIQFFDEYFGDMASIILVDDIDLPGVYTAGPDAAGATVGSNIFIPDTTTGVPYENVIAHEIGHLLGIGYHSEDSGDLMYPVSTHGDLDDLDVTDSQMEDIYDSPLLSLYESDN
ncbi:matrixin family metalloprotease [Roseiconus lacunae]|uniref:matrixin family metalloprotease n=1 Tax=Roseiconus lacunae TaxID=2605694 RepID=UPI0030893673|nr:matrixin family metalloprotease [Stieleria sp. HD01]